MMDSIPYFGEISAFISAVFWAFAVILFKKSGERLHPIALNLFKISLSLFLFIPTMLIFNVAFFPSISWNEYFIFILSGVVGMVIGDTLFFKSLNCIGAGLSAIVDCLYSPFIIIMSMIWLAESLTVLQIIGVALIVCAVLSTLNIKKRIPVSHRELLRGIFWGILAIFAMALSV